MKAIFFALCLVLTLGCRTLDPNGPYNGDKVLYEADRTIAASFDSLHAFVKWEYDNREALRVFPEIRTVADKVRKNASDWISKAIAARDLYARAKDIATRKTLNDALASLRAGIAEASVVIGKAYQ